MGGRSGISMTPRQAMFVEYFIANPNATEAARKAGYSEKTARFIGAENLTKPYIAAAIKQGLLERQERVSMDGDEVIERLAGIAVDAEVATRDRIRALELVGKRHGIFTDHMNVTFVDEIEKRLEAGRQRAAKHNAKQRK